jgi:hypothetical protein
VDGRGLAGRRRLLRAGEHGRAWTSTRGVGAGTRRALPAQRQRARVVGVRRRRAHHPGLRAIASARFGDAGARARNRRSGSVLCLRARASVPNPLRYPARRRVRGDRRRRYRAALVQGTGARCGGCGGGRADAIAAARFRSAPDKGIAAGQRQHDWPSRGDGLPGVALRPPHHHDEHGLARSLHAGSVPRRLPHPGLSARGQWRHLELCRAEAAWHRRVDRHRGTRGGRGRDLRAGSTSAGFSRGVYTRRRRRRRRALSRGPRT